MQNFTFAGVEDGLKTMDSFGFRAQRSINEPLARELLRCEFINRKENVLLMGTSGTGKTHLATALGFAACCQAYKVRSFGCIERDHVD